MDALFVDVHSSETDGIRIAQEASLLLPRMLIVLVTDLPRSQSPIEVQHSGAYDRITRPITPEKIQTALSRANAASLSDERTDATSNGYGSTSEPMSRCAIVAASPDMKKAVLLANQLAETDAPVLIQGEKGVGKALLARTLHHRRHHDPGVFLHLVCNAMQEGQAASLLFPTSDEGDALTAGNGNGGISGRASDGSLFLENVDELPSWAQFKLLDLLERRDETSSPNLRVIASTSCDLKTAANEGRVPQELYYLLSVASIWVPPLRRRREDIRPLAEQMLARFERQSGPPAANGNVRFSRKTWDCLLNHDWPGNGDELANVLQRAILSGKPSPIEASDIEQLLLDNRALATTTETITVALEGDFKDIQRGIIREMIHRCSGNKAAAARSLGLHRKTIYRILQGTDPSAIVNFPAAAGGIEVPVTGELS